jgi:hypothetical protein
MISSPSMPRNVSSESGGDAGKLLGHHAHRIMVIDLGERRCDGSRRAGSIPGIKAYQLCF